MVWYDMVTLNKFGFGNFFCKAVKTLYTNGNSSIKLSHGTSQRFPLNCGVHQGCPLSVYLFLLSVQLLNVQVKASPLKDITIANREIIISQLADDTVLLLKDASQVSVAVTTIQSFSKASGLDLNLNKCELLPVNNCTVSSIFHIPVRDSVTYLGVQIVKDRKLRGSSNLTPIIEQTQKVLNHWLQRDLSRRGRLLLSKAEGIPRLTYAAQSLSVNNSICKSVDKMLSNFLWKNKTLHAKICCFK